MDDRNVVQVDIFGSQYTIRKGSEDPEYIIRVAAYVDQKMREINDKLPVASVSKVAVLASLNLADELFKERDVLGKDKKTLDHLAKSAARLTEALDTLDAPAGRPV
ncbi:MAG: cell division protein ZapA [Candidatus Eiseniibacteriota bacterium]|jgi:cell division protein ZapA